jgi:hypothetical protein
MNFATPTTLRRTGVHAALKSGGGWLKLNSSGTTTSVIWQYINFVIQFYPRRFAWAESYFEFGIMGIQQRKDVT